MLPGLLTAACCRSAASRRSGRPRPPAPTRRHRRGHVRVLRKRLHAAHVRDRHVVHGVEQRLGLQCGGDGARTAPAVAPSGPAVAATVAVHQAPVEGGRPARSADARWRSGCSTPSRPPRALRAQRRPRARPGRRARPTRRRRPTNSHVEVADQVPTTAACCASPARLGRLHHVQQLGHDRGHAREKPGGRRPRRARRPTRARPVRWPASYRPPSVAGGANTQSTPSAQLARSPARSCG